MIKNKNLLLVLNLLLFVTFNSCQDSKKSKTVFKTLVDKKVETIRIGKYRNLYKFPATEKDSSVSLANYVFQSIECNIGTNTYYRIFGSKPIFGDEAVPIRNASGEEQEEYTIDKPSADNSVKGIFITKKDTMYFLRMYFLKQNIDNENIHKIRLVQPIATYSSEDSLYRYFSPLVGSKLEIKKSIEITKKKSTSFNTGSGTSLWATSNIHLRLGSIDIYGENRFGSSNQSTQQEDIKNSLNQLHIDSIQVETHHINQFKYFKTNTKYTSFGYAPFFEEDDVFSALEE